MHLSVSSLHLTVDRNACGSDDLSQLHGKVQISHECLNDGLPVINCGDSVVYINYLSTKKAPRNMEKKSVISNSQ